MWTPCWHRPPPAFSSLHLALFPGLQTGDRCRLKDERRGCGAPGDIPAPHFSLCGVSGSPVCRCHSWSSGCVLPICTQHLSSHGPFCWAKFVGRAPTPPNRLPASVLQVESWGPCPHSGAQLHLATPLQGSMSPGGGRGLAATCGPGGTLIIRERQPGTAQRWPAAPGHPGLFSPGQNKRLLSGRVQRDDCPPRLQLWRGSAIRDTSRSFGHWGAALPHPAHC